MPLITTITSLKRLYIIEGSKKETADVNIAEKFNTYHFADYKEQVIDLLKRVCTVSVETMKVVGKGEIINVYVLELLIHASSCAILTL